MQRRQFTGKVLYLNEYGTLVHSIVVMYCVSLAVVFNTVSDVLYSNSVHCQYQLHPSTFKDTVTK